MGSYHLYTCMSNHCENAIRLLLVGFYVHTSKHMSIMYGPVFHSCAECMAHACQMELNHLSPQTFLAGALGALLIPTFACAHAILHDVL